MNKKVVIAIVVILLLLLGGGVFVMSKRNKSKTTSAPTTISVSPTSAVQETSQENQKSLRDLLTAGVPQKCTFSDVSSEVNMQGTSYIANGKVRGDFSTTADGKTTNGHTIFDGKVSYVWMDGTSTGFKMEINPTEGSTSNSSTQQGLDLNKTLDYNCDVWVPDQTLFTPPTNVTFTSFSVPTSTVEGSTTGNKSLCSSCDSLTGEQKTQCLTALKCNY